MLTRRDLLKFLLATPAAALVDYERLLWVPKPIITVPAMPAVTYAEIEAVYRNYCMASLVETFFRADPLFTRIQRAWKPGTIQANLEYR